MTSTLCVYEARCILRCRDAPDTFQFETVQPHSPFYIFINWFSLVGNITKPGRDMTSTLCVYEARCIVRCLAALDTFQFETVQPHIPFYIFLTGFASSGTQQNLWETWPVRYACTRPDAFCVVSLLKIHFNLKQHSHTVHFIFLLTGLASSAT